jgi:hypothetical protein
MCDKLRVSSPVALENKQPKQNMLGIQVVAYNKIKFQCYLTDMLTSY